MPRGSYRPQCSIENCDRPHYGHGFCNSHYSKLARPPCSIEGCEKPVKNRGWCPMHWKRWYTHGDPLIRTTFQNIEPCFCGEPAKVRGLCFRCLHKAEKQEIIDAYGGSCVCCGETAVEFLSTDHINGDGKQHRQKVSSVYADLKKRGFPQDNYRLLCMNCNFATGQFGYCPHQKE